MPNIIDENTVIHLDQNHLDRGHQERNQQHHEAPANGRLFSVTSEATTLRGILNAAESEAIQRALQHTGWNRKRAAALLKISYRGLLYKIRNHSITPPMAGD